MTTDNRTNEPTIEAAARVIYDHSAVNDEGNVCQCGHETGHDLAYHQAERLHTAGRLVTQKQNGILPNFACTDEQVEAAAKAHKAHGRGDEYAGIVCRECDDYFGDRAGFETHRMRAALAAAAGATQQADSYDHCCQHPKCPGGSLCCSVSEQRLRECWKQWREEVNGGSKQAFRDGYQSGQNDPVPAARVPTSTYISPHLPSMIRNLWKSDPSEKSVRTALGLAGDLIQELIDERATSAVQQVSESELVDVLSAHVLGDPYGGTASWAWIKCSCGEEMRAAGVTREHVVFSGRKHQAREIVAALAGREKNDE